MRKVFKIIALLLSILIILYGIYCTIPKYKFEYFYSPDKKYVITRIFVQSKIFFVYGFYDKKSKPVSYIQPQSVCGFDEGYHCIINWSDSICTIYKCYGIYNRSNLPNNFRLKEIECNNDLNGLWYNMLNDTINNFHDTGPKCKLRLL
jgi:hypothetical protein